jgi:hypothetical protein
LTEIFSQEGLRVPLKDLLTQEMKARILSSANGDMSQELAGLPGQALSVLAAIESLQKEGQPWEWILENEPKISELITSLLPQLQFLSHPDV